MSLLSRTRTAGVLFGLAAGTVALAAGRLRERRRSARDVDELLGAARYRHEYATDDLEDLPSPIRRYLSHALPENCRRIDAVRLDQTGRVRLGDASSPWKPFTATQHVTVDPPGFRWEATVDVAPFLSVTVQDRYVGGAGSARLTLLGAFPFGGTAPSPELNESELMRYLAEAVIYPTALLPSDGVEWDPIDDRSARATIEHGGATVSLVFTVNDRDEVERVDAEARYRSVDGELVPTPWSGFWREYETRDGLRVPTEGEVVWHLPEGDLTAWQGHIDDLEFLTTAR